MDYYWYFFFIVVAVCLFFDLNVVFKKAHVIQLREAYILSIFWIFISILFGVWIYFMMGYEKALLFFTGYIVEKSLSVDNLFVFIVVFGYFAVPNMYQHKVLYWGILGVLLMRGIFIFFGIAAINAYHWVIYIFGLFLIYTAIKLLTNNSNDTLDPSKNIIVKNINKIIRVCNGDHQGQFFKRKPVFCITPLVIVLIVIETTDIMFAFDSVPAVLSITTDPFIVYTSNIFAILGLRALYFVLVQTMASLCYLKHGLSVILGFIGGKMLISSYYTVPTTYSLLFIVTVLVTVFLASRIYIGEKST